MVFRSLAAPLMICSFTPMRTGRAAPILGALPPASVPLLAIIWCPGLPNGNRQSLVRALKLNIAALLMLWPKHVGSANFLLNFIARCLRLRWFTATTLVLYTSPPTRFNISAPSTWKLICTLCVIVLLSGKFMFYMFQQHFNMRTSSQKDCLLLSSSPSDPASTSDPLPVDTAGGCWNIVTHVW